MTVNKAQKFMGINCKDCSLCENVGLDDKLRLKTLKAYMDNVPDYKSWWDSEKIACSASRGPKHWESQQCAFFQWTSGRTLETHLVKAKMQELININCFICGSAPTEDADTTHGALTINYVTEAHKCRDGKSGVCIS
ncbi:hypothetical protein CC80DRAFT_546838 [Byssothecium circinans]|uniref:Killer toxin Kp4 domain-containing protein n=1 Tax=Byssothecium circinans TaxID=147558 RepID=A0A6A5U463_9PLEO|nr:hypothetical protein CC80DRAFT_546838 [Byssothecium circinans]